MTMKIPMFVKKLIYGYRASSETYINRLREMGAKIGDDVTLFHPHGVSISTNEPYLLEIGDHVGFSGPVSIITHDYSWSVIKNKYGYIYGNQKPVRIGSNVFVGWGGVILCGSTIEDNTIIGAHSIVSGHLEGNAVYAGNPARKLMTLDEYVEKRRSRQLDEAADLMMRYQERFGKWPDKSILGEYFFLFENGYDKRPERFEFQLGLMGNYDKSVELLQSRKPQFDGYNVFIEYCEELISAKKSKNL